MTLDAEETRTKHSVKISLVLLTCLIAVYPSSAATDYEAQIGSTGSVTYNQKGLTWLHVVGRWIKDQNNTTFTIKGAGDEILGYSLANYAEYFTPARFDLMKSAGANTYRLGVSMDTFDNPPNAALVDQAISYCKARGIYVILDLHMPYTGGDCGPGWQTIFDNPEPWYEWWEARARQYLNEPTVAFYEIVNEPLDTYSSSLAAQWYTMATTVAQRIHAINPSAVLIVGDISWNSALRTFENNPLNEPNIVYSIHRYYHFTPWEDWYSAYWNAKTETDFQNAYALMKNFFYDNGFDMLDKGYPVITTEFGAWRGDPQYGYPADSNYLRQISDQLRMFNEWQAGFLHYTFIGRAETYSTTLTMLEEDGSTLNDVGVAWAESL